MSAPSAKDIEQHIIEHQILGITQGGGGGGGDVSILNGYAVYTDPVRGKVLSTSRATVMATKKGRTSTLLASDGNYLSVGDVVMSKTGWRCPRAATITLISYQVSEVGTFTIHIRTNDSQANLLSIPVVSGSGGQNTTVNLNINTGDYLQVYVQGLAKDPVVSLEVAWRF